VPRAITSRSVAPLSFNFSDSSLPNFAIFLVPARGCGTNTPEEKTRFVAEAFALLRKVSGPDLPEVSYVLVHDIPMNSWGYGGRTQESRAQQPT